MMISARSAGARNSLRARGAPGSFSGTGLSSKPPSVPICQKGGPGWQVKPRSRYPCVIAVADQVERRQTGIDVDARDPQCMVVEPQGGGLLNIGIVVAVGDETLAFDGEAGGEPGIGVSIKRRRH